MTVLACLFTVLAHIAPGGSATSDTEVGSCAPNRPNESSFVMRTFAVPGTTGTVGLALDLNTLKAVEAAVAFHAKYYSDHGRPISGNQLLFVHRKDNLVFVRVNPDFLSQRQAGGARYLGVTRYCTSGTKKTKQAYGAGACADLKDLGARPFPDDPRTSDVAGDAVSRPHSAPISQTTTPPQISMPDIWLDDIQNEGDGSYVVDSRDGSVVYMDNAISEFENAKDLQILVDPEEFDKNLNPPGH